jgi:ABC-type multidrug transport system ATPase subunit
VETGEFFGLLGPNGAGKSTMIQMLTTLLPSTAGTAVIRGFDVVKQADGVRHAIRRRPGLCGSPFGRHPCDLRPRAFHK